MLYEFDTRLTTSTTTSIDIQTEATDEQLMARLREGDEAALSMLFHRHQAILRTVIARVIHNDADVDDLMQEAMIELWNRCKAYDETKGKVLGWLVTMARRRAIDRVRRRQAYDRAEERLRIHVEDNSQAPDVVSVEEQVMSTDRAKFMSQMLETLPEAQKEAVQLAFYRGMSQREIAAKTGIPLGTIKTRLELAVRKLRANIVAIGGEEWGFTAAC
ncbi:RNA polymerase, sigma-24 subunit, ECF subfamily [Chthoniobacter flavus Ellin428]|uniref:RNA polymerase, sigma-24 subunit, ECF subfamily n=1 Tax=Chthoniobacter flavus Ellin428 TaxID=497964 RepID=B4D2Q6_9BACT|nr:sigma-70 family RNA polymerase sigma factor [Chthoniobacter flavus]EDY19496.1 RNA polymerase, sigma-24 subunit, ECF subfamily [Chthoniobacter flavus Ellin428]TCO90380.1 RNA polymerase sigma-70 factor (ECF subfamily) [Chthoniobacter flavus]